MAVGSFTPEKKKKTTTSKYSPNIGAFTKKSIKSQKSNQNKKTSTGSSPAKQATGLATRIQSSGGDVNQALDKRNFVEKALNLPQDQNVLFDVLELIGRPQQAIFSGVKEYQKGGSTDKILKKAGEGFSGNDYTYGGELLRNAGIGDDKGFGVDDVLGFGLDVFADPLSIPLMPVKGAKAGQVALKSGDDILFSALGKGVKGASKIADTGVEKVLKNVDLAKGLTYDNAAKGVRASALRSGGQEIQKGALKSYRGVKNAVSDTFSSLSGLPKRLIDDIRKTDGLEEQARREMKNVAVQLNKNIDNYAKVVGKKSDEVGRDLLDYIEYKDYKPKIDLKEAIKESRNVIDDDNVYKFLEKVARDHKLLETEDVLDYSKIGKSKTAKGETLEMLKQGVNPIEELVARADGKSGTFRYTDKIDTSHLFRKGGAGGIEISPRLKEIIEDLPGDLIIDLKRRYNAGDIKRFKALEKNKNFLSLVDEARPTYTKLRNTLDKNMNTNYSGNDMKGYIYHTPTEAGKNAINIINKEIYGDSVALNTITGNKNLANNRKRPLSVLEENRFLRGVIEDKLSNPNIKEETRKAFERAIESDFFKTDLQSTISDFIEKYPKYTGQAKRIDDILVKTTLEDPTLINFNPTLPKPSQGMRRVEGKPLKDKLIKLNRHLDSKDIKDFVNRMGNGAVDIDNRLFNLVSTGLDMEKETNAIINLSDQFLNKFFKPFKLLSPQFHLNNIAGNLSNMYLSGVPITKSIEMYPKSAKIFKKAKEAIDIIEKGGKLTDDLADAYKIFKEFEQAGFTDVAKNVQDIGSVMDEIRKKTAKKNIAKETIDNIIDMNFKANEAMDKLSRMSTFLYAKENPNYLTKLNVKSPAEAVRTVLFDYKDLSEIERNVIKKVIPFYTFIKKNLSFQIGNISKNTTKYKNVYKAYRGLLDFTGNDLDDIEGYKKDSMYLPIPGLNKDGKITMLKTSFPMTDLGNYFNSPKDFFSSVTASTSPLIRVPFEIATNTETFTGNPIEKYKGQSGYQGLGLSRMQEYLLSQTGLDVPIKGVKSVTEGLQGISQGGDVVTNLLNALRITSQTDKNRVQLDKQYDQVTDLTNYMKELKKQGTNVKTLKELEVESSKSNIDIIRKKLEQQLVKLRGETE